MWLAARRKAQSSTGPAMLAATAGKTTASKSGTEVPEGPEAIGIGSYGHSFGHGRGSGRMVGYTEVMPVRGLLPYALSSAGNQCRAARNGKAG